MIQNPVAGPLARYIVTQILKFGKLKLDVY